MRDRNVPQYLINLISDYFTDRTIVADGQDIRLTMGVPQGSVLGPTLWNILYDDIFRIQFPAGIKTVGYADDLAVVVSADDVRVLNARLENAIGTVQQWLIDHFLYLAPAKSDAVVLKGPRKRDAIRIMVDGQQIQLSKQVKYLGVFLDTHGHFGGHMKHIVDKANSRTAALTKLLPNIGGPGLMKRHLMWGVVQSTILYAAPIWARALRVGKYSKMLEATQRKMLLRVCSAYRTTSAKAVQVVAGIPPIDLLVQERSRVYEMPRNPDPRQAQRVVTLELWQSRWEATVDVAQWTKRLIPNLIGWIGCPHRRTDYHFTQFLTGHGSFGTYVKRIGKRREEACIYCHAPVDDPEHTVFHCPRWQTVRQREWGDLHPQLTPDNIIDLMIEDRRIWEKAARGIRTIMREKEVEEREQERAVRAAMAQQVV